MKVVANSGPIMALGKVEILVQAIITRDDIWIAEELCRRVLAALRTEAQ